MTNHAPIADPQAAPERLLAKLEAESVVPLHIAEAELLEGRTPHRSRLAVRDSYRKDACPRGHPLTGWNIYHRRDGRRECRLCRNNRDRSIDFWLA